MRSPPPNTKPENIKKNEAFAKKLNEANLEFSVQKTKYLFQKRLSVKEIAGIRKIKEAAVWGHLAELIQHRQISLWKVIPKRKIFKIRSKIYCKNDTLKDIKSRLNDDSITFDEISCVLAGSKK